MSKLGSWDGQVREGSWVFHPGLLIICCLFRDPEQVGTPVWTAGV